MSQLSVTNKEFLNRMGFAVLNSLVEALKCNGLEVPERVYLGFDEPPQDCCPELTAWISGLRWWDGDFDSRGSNVREAVGWAFDVSIRIGRCYVESDDNGQPMDAETLQGWTEQINQDGNTLYVGWIGNWQRGEVEELDLCDLMTVGPLTPYNSGGCAGWQFTITMGVNW